MQFSNEEHLSATQKDPDDFIMDTITTGDDVEDDADSKAALPELWGRLVSRGQKSTTYDLRVNVKPAIDEKHHLHSLGRSSECDIRLGSSTRISNRHCVIYCKVNNTDRNHPYYEAYVEDQSTNGTVVNKKYKLVKKVPRLLRSGDEIYLVNPEVVKLLNVPEVEVENSSFVVILYLPANLQKSIYANQKNLRMQPSSSSNGHAITRSTTVVRMLNQNRNIHDFYEFRELLGTGTSGMVYRGIQKDTGRDWAIKVIDIRKFSLSENFNSSNLVNSNDADQAAAAITKEAEMLRSLKHPNIIRLEDIFADQGHNLFLVMELSTGSPVFDVFDQT